MCTICQRRIIGTPGKPSGCVRIFFYYNFTLIKLMLGCIIIRAVFLTFDALMNGLEIILSVLIVERLQLRIEPKNFNQVHYFL